MPRAWRPDRCGFLISLSVNELHGAGVTVTEFRKGALRHNDQAILKYCYDLPCTLITINYLDGSRKLLSRDRVWIDDLRRRNNLPIPSNAKSVMIDIDVEQNGRMSVAFE